MKKAISTAVSVVVLLTTATSAFAQSAKLPGQSQKYDLTIGDSSGLITTTYAAKMFNVKKTDSGFIFYVKAGKGSPLYKSHKEDNPDSGFP
jgi:hypothetical protein